MNAARKRAKPMASALAPAHVRSSRRRTTRPQVAASPFRWRKVETGNASVRAAAGSFGLARLLPAKPGPRRAHKLTDEVLDYAAELLAADPQHSGRALLPKRCNSTSGCRCTRVRSSAP